MCLLLVRCSRPGKPPPSLARTAVRQFIAAHYDSAIRSWNAAFEAFKAAGQWDSIYGYEEKYIIAHSRIYQVAEAHAFLDMVNAHICAQRPVDSIELSKLWVRRSELLYTAGKPRLARDTLLAVLRLRQRRLPSPHPLLADACDYLQIAYAEEGNLWTAADYGETGIRLYKACLAAGWDQDACSNLPWMIGNAGEVYNNLGYYDRAITLLREAYDRLCASRGPIDSRMNYLIELGGSYRRKGDFREAITLFKAAVDSLKATDSRSFEAEAYKQLALCYKEAGLRDQMLLYARRQYEISTALHQGRSHTEQAQSAALLADCRLSAEDQAGADRYIREALRIYRDIGDSTSLDFISTLSLQGRLFGARRFADSARMLFDAVIRKRIALVGDTNDLVAVALLEAAHNEDAAGRFQASSRAAARALQLFSRTRNAGHPYLRECRYLLARASWKGRGDKRAALQLIRQGIGQTAGPAGGWSIDRSYLQLLELRAALLLPDSASTAVSAWQESLDSYQRLQEAYQQFVCLSVFEGARFTDGGTVIQAIKDGFLPAFRLYRLTGKEAYLQAALDCSEQSRTGSIRLALQHYEANRFAGVPDSIIAQEEALRINCAYYEQLLLGAQGMQAPAWRTAQWNDSLLAMRARYTALIQQVADRYPAYYRLKLDNRTLSLSAMKQLAAGQHTVLVEYIVSGRRLYAFVCDGTTCSLQPLPAGRDRLMALTADYRAAMARADAPAFADASWQLYAAAVLPLAPLLREADVCVIPDDALSYVSFESLLTAPAAGAAGFRGLPYAIRQHNWHYAYSATVLARQSALYSHKRDAMQAHMAAIAPGFDQEVKAAAAGRVRDSRFMQLLRQPWALQLAGDLKKRRGARAYTGTSATEEAYNELAGNAAVLYIGTHAFPDDHDPMESELVFSKSAGGGALVPDGYLHAYEIYRLPVKMRLVVLGGCETGIGRLRSGEGIVSLASGFAYAGCPSVVMSLWSIDDQQSAAILRSFFANAGSNQPISTALSSAKRHYLQLGGDEDALYNPLYWSGLVSMGLDEPVPVPTQRSYRYPVLGVVFAIALLLVVAGILRGRRRVIRPFRQ